MADIQEFSIGINFNTNTASANKTTQAVSGVSKSLSKLTNIAKTVAIGATFKKLGSNIFGLTQNMSDYIESVNLFRSSMGDASNQAQKFIDKAEKLLGLDPENLMNSFASFYNLANGFGIASDRAYIMSQNLTQLSADLSSFANISVETAQQKLMSGFSGQVMPLRQYGIALDQATLQEKAYELGLSKKVKEMTRAEKSELIYYQIMTSTQKMQGDLGRSLLSPANSIRVVQQEFKSLARAVGSIFIPMLMKVIPVVRAVTQIITEGAKAIARLFGFEMGDFNSDLSTVGNLLTGINDDVGGIGENAEESAKKLNKMLMPFDELNNLTTSQSSGAGAGGLGDIGGAGGLGLELPQYDMFASMSGNMDKAIEGIKTKLATLFEPIKLAWGNQGAPTIEAFKNALGSVSGLFGTIGASFEKVWQSGEGQRTVETLLGILQAVLGTISGIATAWTNAWNNNDNGTKIVENLWKALNNVLETIQGIARKFEEISKSESFQTLMNTVVSIFEKVSGVMERISEKTKDLTTGELADTFQKLTEILGILSPVIEFVADVIIKLVELELQNKLRDLKQFIETINARLTTFKGILDIIVGIFSLDFDRAVKGVGEVFEGFFKSITLPIKGVGEKFRLFGEALGNIFGPILENIGTWFSNTWEGIKSTWETVSNWFNEHVVEPVKKFFEPLFEWFSKLFNSIGNTIKSVFNVIGGLAQGCVNTIKIIWEKVSGWFNEHVVEPIKEKFGGAWNKLKEGAEKAWNGIKEVFGKVGTFFKDTFEKAWNGVKNLFSIGGKIFDGIKEGIVSSFKKIVNAIIKGINKVIKLPFDGINGALNIIRNIDIFGNKPFGGLPTISVPQIPELPEYAKGGFVNRGQMFIANEAGPELIGRIGNRTAVANQNQIVEAVSRGVSDAVSQVMSKDNSTPYIVVNVGDEKLYSGYGKYQNQQSNMYGVTI